MWTSVLIYISPHRKILSQHYLLWSFQWLLMPCPLYTKLSAHSYWLSVCICFEYSKGSYYQTICLDACYAWELIIIFRLLICGSTASHRLLHRFLTFSLFCFLVHSVHFIFEPRFIWSFFLSYFCSLLKVRNLVFIACTQIMITCGLSQMSTVLY